MLNFTGFITWWM